MQRIHPTATGTQYRRTWTPGPAPKGYKKVLVNLPPEYVELMKIQNEQCGGLLPVNEQIRRAVRGYLCGLVYIGLVKQ